MSTTALRSRLCEILARFEKRCAADPSEIEEFERVAGLNLPEDYKRFLLFTNGGEGFVGPNSYAMLWKISDLLTFNREYDVQEKAPGLLLFGSSGGGEAFAFDFRSGSRTIISVPFIGMDLKEIIPIASTFDAFLEALYRR